jgi:hypothetical protein
MNEGNNSLPPKRKYPPLYEKIIPLALIVIAVAIIALLVIVFAVLLGLLPLIQ